MSASTLTSTRGQNPNGGPEPARSGSRPIVARISRVTPPTERESPAASSRRSASAGSRSAPHVVPDRANAASRGTGTSSSRCASNRPTRGYRSSTALSSTSTPASTPGCRAMVRISTKWVNAAAVRSRYSWSAGARSRYTARNTRSPPRISLPSARSPVTIELAVDSTPAMDATPSARQPRKTPNPRSARAPWRSSRNANRSATDAMADIRTRPARRFGRARPPTGTRQPRSRPGRPPCGCCGHRARPAAARG